MRPNVICPRCDGSGTTTEWARDAARGGWHRVIGTCDDCLGVGKRPARFNPAALGLISVHSLRASVYSIEELLALLEVPDEEEEDGDPEEEG